MGVLNSTVDPRNLDAWAIAIGSGSGTLRTWCRAAHLSTKSSLDFARLLRAVVRCQGIHWDPQNILDIVDPRTLDGLFERGGLLASRVGQLPPTCQAFLAGQHLIAEKASLQAIARLLEANEKSTSAPVRSTRRADR